MPDIWNELPDDESTQPGAALRALPLGQQMRPWDSYQTLSALAALQTTPDAVLVAARDRLVLQRGDLIIDLRGYEPQGGLWQEVQTDILALTHAIGALTAVLDRRVMVRTSGVDL